MVVVDPNHPSFRRVLVASDVSRLVGLVVEVESRWLAKSDVSQGKKQIGSGFDVLGYVLAVSFVDEDNDGESWHCRCWAETTTKTSDPYYHSRTRTRTEMQNLVHGHFVVEIVFGRHCRSGWDSKHVDRPTIRVGKRHKQPEPWFQRTTWILPWKIVVVTATVVVVVVVAAAKVVVYGCHSMVVP